VPAGWARTWEERAQAKQQEEKRLRRERKLLLEDQRRNDPAYKKKISPRKALADARSSGARKLLAQMR